MTYVGLRDDENDPYVPYRPRRIALDQYVWMLESLKKAVVQSNAAPQDRPQLVKRCRAITQDQLQVFYIDKFDPGVYVPRSGYTVLE